MAQYFIMMVGLPASGKSYYANIYKDTYEAVIHSSDKTRADIFESESVQDDNKKVFEILHGKIIEDLKNGKSVIYDATNIHYKRRMSFLSELNKIKQEIYKICLFIATPYNDCLKQNEKRDREVPPYVIERMYKNIYIPQYYEGWDEIVLILKKGTSQTLKELFDYLCTVNQDNPHHTLSVGDHCLKTFWNIKTRDNDDFEVLNTAAMLHDIGKGFTKTFFNLKGEMTDIAHYYQHHLVSAYDSLFCHKTYKQSGFILEVANYIQWHMQPFFIENEKTRNKYVSLWGKEFYDNLMILHEADVNSK